MSKSLPNILVLATAQILTSGCGPSSAALLEVMPSEDDTSSTITREPEAPRRPDAGRDAGSAGRDAKATEVPAYAELEDPEGCVVLPDQTVPERLSDASAARLVKGRTATAVGCGPGDAGAAEALLQTSVYSRSDGQPLVERGETYSYRWEQTTFVVRVRLEGGQSGCAAEPIVARDHGYHMTAVPLTQYTCYEFRSPIDAHYVRTYGGDYYGLPQVTLGQAPLLMKLCRSPCPPGTAFNFADGGVGDAGVDAGFVIPPVPAP